MTFAALVLAALLAVGCVVLVALPFLREPAPESEALSLGASVNDLGPEIERRPCASTLPDRAAKRILRTYKRDC